MNKDYAAVVNQITSNTLKTAELRNEFLLLQIVRKLCDIEQAILQMPMMNDPDILPPGIPTAEEEFAEQQRIQSERSSKTDKG